MKKEQKLETLLGLKLNAKHLCYNKMRQKMITGTGSSAVYVHNLCRMSSD